MADEEGAPLTAAPFAAAFLPLGSLLRRYLVRLEGRQLVVALSVPCRDYVAALIGAGWMLSAPAPELDRPIDVFHRAERHTYLRAVTEKKVVTGVFSSLDETRTPPRVITGGKNRTVDWYKAVAVLDDACDSIESDVPEPGFLAGLTGAATTWLQRIASPPKDLVLVGTSKWLREDLASRLGNAAVEGAAGTALGNYVLPINDKAATWATPIVSSARMREGDEIPSGRTMAVLDGYGAVKHLNNITVPIIVCVIDRSIADDSAAELVVQARVSNTRPISIKEDLRWQPPIGVEALAFTGAL
ncbi:hypothetical protein A5750_22885 [Mycobacterium sp. 852002-51613_SCH5001154]|nr:hypothetical protein A5750_22885 [Mycobacterium sp. 852002-51613_SCH5001154]